MVASDVGQGPSGMFALMTQCEACILQFFTINSTGTTPATQITVNMTTIADVLAAKVPHASHPVVNNNNTPNLTTGMTALQTFYTSTMANMTAGTCGPPKTF
jgi:hypothetical protein